MQELKDNSLSVQIGGNHYHNSDYQPIEFMEKVNMHPSCCFVFKYVYRHKDKNGLQDLQKAKHCVELIGATCCKWYDGISHDLLREIDLKKTQGEFWKFIKCNPQLDINQIKAILAIMNKDAETLKNVIESEIEEFYL